MKIILIIILLSFSSISLTYAKSLNPLSNNQESINSGKKLYAIKCSKCHGPKAKGITNGHTKTPSLKKYKRGYTVFIDIIKNGYIRMPAWGGMGKLNDKQLNEIAAFIERIANNSSNWIK